MSHAIRHGITLTESTGDNLVDVATGDAREAAELGVGSVWLGQRMDYDAIGLAGLVGREVPGMHVGVAAIPVFGRHPLTVASQAQTTQAATHGHLHLALALGAAPLAEQAYGASWDRPIARLREYLQVLGSILHTGAVDHDGELITARSLMPVEVPGSRPPVPLLVAAMAPQALRVAGELADGVVPFLAGPAVLAEHIVPRLTGAARRADRPAPRVVTLVPAVVTDDVAGARAAMADRLAFYAQFPSYRRVLDLGDVADLADAAVIGDEDAVAAGLERYVDAGATEIVVTAHDVVGHETRHRTWRLVGDLARRSTRPT